MKVRSRVTGDVLDVPEDAATVLVEAGIYDAVDESKVEPLTTKDSPTLKKKVR